MLAPVLLAGTCLIAAAACTGAPSAELSETAVSSEPPSTASVPYGPDPTQLLDIYQPTAGGRTGTIVYLHAGGWISGSRTKVSELIASQLSRGWAVVSIDYRLAPAARAAEMLGDVDRALRWVRHDGPHHGLAGPVVVAGGSAGGHLAAMAGAAAGVWADPDLPADLAATPPRPDGVIDMVGPADLSTFWQVGGWAPDTSFQLMGCALGPTSLDLPQCDPQVPADLSPTEWARRAGRSGTELPPAFLAYGPDDALVPTSTQGDPLFEAWTAAAPPGSVHYEHPPGAGHNIESQIDRAALEQWLDHLGAGTS